MLNHIVKAASGTISHTALFDAMFGDERPDYLANCPESYINPVFAEMAKIVDIKAFKKEAVAGFSAMGLDADVKDNIVGAIDEAKTAVEVARVIYGTGVYLLTELASTQPELMEVLAKRWSEDSVAEKVKNDGFYTDEAEQAMLVLCRSVFEDRPADLVIEEPTKATAEPVKAEATVTTGPSPVRQQHPGAKKGNKGSQQN